MLEISNVLLRSQCLIFILWKLAGNSGNLFQLLVEDINAYGNPDQY